ncbi:hypothetical protein OG235_03265 [Streptomyces sp. NBC_00024]|uniref:hypothetical protein n=1 Tax=Streptomyces sp. NBC_00024 TaxID=2903612 RepID=UPI00325537E2
MTESDHDFDTGLSRVSADTDGLHALLRLHTLLHERLGTELIHLGDPALDAAATGKIAQRLCVPAGTARERALLDTEADQRVIQHLILHPDSVDSCTGRRRRVALISNASAVADLGPLSAATVLPALESAAALLRRATGLDVHPLPITAHTPQDLAATVAALAPGFAAVCLAHTHPAYVEVVRACFGSPFCSATPGTLPHSRLRSSGRDPHRRTGRKAKYAQYEAFRPARREHVPDAAEPPFGRRRDFRNTP